jgi:hypothetical protein
MGRTKQRHWLGATALTIAGTLACHNAALGFGGKPEHSTVEATVAPGASDALTLTFKVVPKTGMKINLEGPWKLELKDAADLPLAKTTLVRADLDEGMTGYTVTTTAKPAKTEGTVNYSLTSFICTTDKTQCYREVHTGTLPWKAGAKS